MRLNWEERYAWARDPILPWVERVVPLAGRSVVEFGAGEGSVTCAIAELGAASVLALDIDAEGIEKGKRKAAERGLDAIEFVDAPYDDLINEVRRMTNADVFFLYAVLEHMTIEERLETLALAQEVIGTDGYIVVCETPNRLLPWDYHTSQLPFFNMLPDELALRYLGRSEREEFTNDLATYLTQGESVARERLVRWGRGVSFHEFELVFDDFPANVVACNYEPELLAVREIYSEELNLARLLRRVRPDIPPAFTRYWIDAVIAGNPDHPRRFFEPWAFETTNAQDVDFTEWDTLLFRGPQSSLQAHLDRPTDEVVLGFENHSRPMELRVFPDQREPIVFTVDLVESGKPVYVRAPLPDRAQVVTLEVSEKSLLSFFGFASHR